MILTYRAIGVTLHHRTPTKRQVRWEDDTCSHSDQPEVLAFDDGQRFECFVTYDGDARRMLIMDRIIPLEPLVFDPDESKRLWDSIQTSRELPSSPDCDWDSIL